jgi:hypothetical protein
MFASTTSLNLRAYRDSDLEKLVAMYNDPRVSRTATLGYITPYSPSQGKKFVESHDHALLHVVLELKSPKEEEEEFVGHL